MSFKLISEQILSVLDVTLQTFQHPGGLQHIHVQTDDQESAFAVAFPTPPTSDDGRAHILEHLVLSGSQKFPVRETFQAMTQRSLASFMNAMTYPDRTIYPFSSPDMEDFKNLMDVYLDATFFPLLRKQDFQQEGWRHVLREPNGPLQVDGVVFNEMKGALASRNRMAHQQITSVLMEGTAYAFQSGGDPLHIPELTYEDLVQFHRQHYHPSQAVVFTYGQFPASFIQERLLDVIARRSDEPGQRPSIPMTTTLKEPTRATLPVPPSEEDEHEEQSGDHQLIRSWVIGPSYENDTGMVANFMAMALMGSDAAPLSQRMSQQGFGRQSDLCGPDPNSKEVALIVGMDGLNPDQTPAVEAMIQQTLEEVAQNGLDPDHLQSVFHEFEVMAREMGNQMPLGLEMILEMAPAVLAGSDPARTINPDVLNEWEDRLTDPAFSAQWVRENLLDNPRQAVVVLEPKADWFEELETKELAMLEQRLAGWGQAEREAAIKELEAFESRTQVTDNSSLPIIDLSRVSREPMATLPHDFQPGTPDKAATLFVRASTRGIGEANIYVDLNAIPAEQWQWVDITWSLIEGMGVGDRDWMETAHWRNQHLQGFKTASGAFAIRNGQESWQRYAAIHGQLLERHSQGMAEALADTLMDVRFDDIERLTFMLQEQQESLRASLANMGNRLAALEASAPFSPLTNAMRQCAGRPMLSFIDHLVDQIQTNPQAVVEKLEKTHRLLLAQPRMVTALGSEAMHAPLVDLAQRVAGVPAWHELGTGAPITRLDTQAPVMMALTSRTPVQFCHQTWQTIGQDHPDAPIFEVLAQALRNGPLHSAIREKGSAYGAIAQASNGFFSVSSYRDPRLKGTFDDFDRIVEASKDYEWSDEELHQAKLSVIQRLSAPQSPTKRAKSTMAILLSGMTDGQRRSYRETILNATGEDLRRVATKYLVKGMENKTAFTSEAKAKEMPEMDVEPAWPAPMV